MCELYRNNEDEYSYFSSMHALQQDSWENLSAVYYISYSLREISEKNLKVI